MMDWSKYYPANYTAITAEDVRMIQELKRAQAEDNTNNKADDGEGLDKVQPKALKKKFDKRKDTDLDNDGDTDDSDEFIHTKRKAISKAIDDEEEEDEKSEAMDPAIARQKSKDAAHKKQLTQQQGGVRKATVASNPAAHDAAQAQRERQQSEDAQDDARLAFHQGDDAYAQHQAGKKKEKPKGKGLPVNTTDQERKRDEWRAKKESWYPVDEKRLKQKRSENKKDYRDDNLKKTVKGIEEPEFSKKQDTVTNMEDRAADEISGRGDKVSTKTRNQQAAKDRKPTHNLYDPHAEHRPNAKGDSALNNDPRRFKRLPSTEVGSNKGVGKKVDPDKQAAALSKSAISDLTKKLKPKKEAWAIDVINKYHNIEEHCGWCEQGITNEKEALQELSTSKDIAKQIKELAKAVRGKDRLSLEGASKFVEKKQYDKLAPYLDKMSEEARQSVLMVLMNDQKIANIVMKKMKTEEYDTCEIPSHRYILGEMYRKYQGLTWGEIGERLIKNTERRLVSLAYATKLGTIDAPSPEVQKLADECELEDLEKASKQFIEDDSDLKEAVPVKPKPNQFAAKPNTPAKPASPTAPKPTAPTAPKPAAPDREAERERKAKEAEKRRQARLSDDPGLKRGVETSKRGKVLGAVASAMLGSHEPEGQSIGEEEIADLTPERLDARRRIFREKIKKLAYEKAVKILGKRGPVEAEITGEEKKEEKEEDSSKVKESGKINNKVKMNPEVEKEMKESSGLAFVRKYKNKMDEVNKEGETSLENQILELFRSSFGSTDGEPAGAEFAIDDEPASASSIARMLRCSPTEVQKLLDDMVEAGRFTRVGDAYSYASPRPAEPMGVKLHGPGHVDH